MKLTTDTEKKDWIKKRIGFIDGKTLTIALNRYWTNSAKKIEKEYNTEEEARKIGLID